VKIQKFDSINVVPFIDIMLVLLVIVLTTATFIARGIIPVELPKASTAVQKLEKKDLAITVMRDGRVFFQKQEVARDHIVSELAKYDTATPIRLNCDKDARFESFVFILDILKAQRFKNLGIVAKK
jgi:biopolymer transport protein ExbD